MTIRDARGDEVMYQLAMKTVELNLDCGWETGGSGDALDCCLFVHYGSVLVWQRASINTVPTVDDAAMIVIRLDGSPRCLCCLCKKAIESGDVSLVTWYQS